MKTSLPHFSLGLLIAVTWFAQPDRAGGCPTAMMSAPSPFGVGVGPIAVAVGDLNHDGHLDLVVADSQRSGAHPPGTISILLGRGDGTFAPASKRNVGNEPTDVCIADLNQDGHPDLAVVNSFSDNVSVLLGRGDGTFGVATNFAAGANTTRVLVGDFNRDNHPDLVIESSWEQSVSVLLGRGDGTFRSRIVSPAGNYPAWGLGLADFNSDGILDVVVANQQVATVSILLGNGNGSFRPPVSFPAASGPNGLTVADFNRDGKADVAVAGGWDNSVSVLLGDGTGRLGSRVDCVASSPIWAAASDVNGDGLPDLLGSEWRERRLLVWLGRGDGTFASAQPVAAGSGAWVIAEGDFNEDGAPDFAVTNHDADTVSILLNLCPAVPRVSLPASRVVLREGAPAALAMEVTGRPMPAVQWLFNGQPIAGAMSPTLSLPMVRRTDEGQYQVVASNSVAVVTGKPLLVLVSNVEVEPQLQLTWVGGDAGPTSLQSRAGVAPDQPWQTVSNFPPAVAVMTYREPRPVNGMRLFQLEGTATPRFTSIGLVDSWWLHEPAGTRLRVEYLEGATGWTNWLVLTNLILPDTPYYFLDETSLGSPGRVYRTTVVP